MFGDIRYSLRQYRRSPGFAATAILTLALGIGANTTVFSVADAVLFRPLAYPKSDRLVLIWEQLRNVGVRQSRLSATTLEAYSADRSTFEAVATFREFDENLVRSGKGGRVSVISISSGLLGMLGAQTVTGRPLIEQDWQPEHNRVALISHRLFVQRFNADTQAIGQSIHLNDQVYTVIGVLDPNFEFGLRPGGSDIWIPQQPVKDRLQAQFTVLARLRPGVDLTRARESVAGTAKYLNGTIHPYRGPNGEDIGYGATGVSLQEQVMGDFKGGALILMAAVGLVLLIACVNVASLLLVRTAGREREIAIRRALGASRNRLIRQWISEAAVLTFLGGAAGVLVSQWGLAVLKLLSPLNLPVVAKVSIDERALSFTLLVSFIVCLMFGLVPAFVSAPIDKGLRKGNRKTRAFSLLIATEVALALMLLVSAGLLLRSLSHLRRIDPGFRADHLIAMQVQLTGPHYDDARRRVSLFSRLRQHLSALPGVVSVSSVSRLPVGLRVGSMEGRGGNPFSLERSPWNPNTSSRQIAHTQTVGLDYFQTMGIHVLVGRGFSDTDTSDTRPVAIVNETLAERFFPKDDAIGQRLLLGAPEPSAKWMEIVGIVSDIKSATLDEPPIPQFYMPETQDAPKSMNIVMRTSGDPREIGGQAMMIAQSLAPEELVSDLTTMDERVEKSLGHPRFHAMLMMFFSGSALLLAAVGIYGVVAQATIRRTQEIGVRMALGADATRIVKSVLSDGLRPVAAGIVIGLVGGRGHCTFSFEYFVRS